MKTKVFAINTSYNGSGGKYISKGKRRPIAGPVVFTECNMPGSIKTRANRNRAIEPGLSDQPICVVFDCD